MNLKNGEDGNGKDGGMMKMPSAERKKKFNPSVYLLVLQIFFAADASISLQTVQNLAIMNERHLCFSRKDFKLFQFSTFVLLKNFEI